MSGFTDLSTVLPTFTPGTKPATCEEIGEWFEFCDNQIDKVTVPKWAKTCFGCYFTEMMSDPRIIEVEDIHGKPSYVDLLRYISQKIMNVVSMCISPGNHVILPAEPGDTQLQSGIITMPMLRYVATTCIRVAIGYLMTDTPVNFTVFMDNNHAGGVYSIIFGHAIGNMCSKLEGWDSRVECHTNVSLAGARLIIKMLTLMMIPRPIRAYRAMLNARNSIYQVKVQQKVLSDEGKRKMVYDYAGTLALFNDLASLVPYDGTHIAWNREGFEEVEAVTIMD